MLHAQSIGSAGSSEVTELPVPRSLSVLAGSLDRLELITDRLHERVAAAGLLTPEPAGTATPKAPEPVSLSQRIDFQMERVHRCADHIESLLARLTT